jgi:hypothetical protein
MSFIKGKKLCEHKTRRGSTGFVEVPMMGFIEEKNNYVFFFS